MNFNNKNYFITGASSGIGRQCATDLLSSCANVLITARRENLLKDLLSTYDNDKNIYCASEITDYDKIHETLKDFVNKNGKLNGLVFSHGIEYKLPINMMNGDKYIDIFNINTISILELIKICSKKKYFSESGGSIVVIASLAGVIGTPGHTAYSATKGGLISAVKSIALELSSKKIRINCVSPGLVETPLLENTLSQLSQGQIQAVKDDYPLGIGKTSDVSGVVQFLLSDASRWITGQNLVIDGGFSIK